MSVRAVLASKWLPQATLSSANAANQVVAKRDPIIVTTSNDVAGLFAGIFMAAPSGVVKRATTGNTLTGWTNSPPMGALGVPLQAGYVPVSTAAQVSVLDLTAGPIFQMIDNTSTAADTLYGQATTAVVDINGGGVYCDIVNGTDVTDTAAPGTADPVPIGSVLLKSDTYNVTVGALQMRILGLSKEPGNTSAPYKYDVQCVKYQ